LDFLTPPSQPCVLAKACRLTLRDQNKRRPVSLGVTGRPNSAFARVPGGKNRH